MKDCYISVSCGHLMKQAIADETKQGLAAKAYIEKGMMGKSITRLTYNFTFTWFKPKTTACDKLIFIHLFIHLKKFYSSYKKSLDYTPVKLFCVDSARFFS